MKCRFTSMEPGLKGRLESPGSMARFEDCTFEYLPSDRPRGRREKRPITEINPAWK